MAQSLTIKRQRVELEQVAASIGTRLLYLKSAWADPVLFGGRGDRWGDDIDVLVTPRAYGAMCRALEIAGYVAKFEETHAESTRASKEMHFDPPTGGLEIDLQPRPCNAPWFDWPVEPLIDRAISYRSDDGRSSRWLRTIRCSTPRRTTPITD